MLDDVLTVIWKERKGLFRYRGSRTRFLLVLNQSRPLIGTKATSMDQAESVSMSPS